jgi:hypothetical protein
VTGAVLTVVKGTTNQVPPYAVPMPAGGQGERNVATRDHERGVGSDCCTRRRIGTGDDGAVVVCIDPLPIERIHWNGACVRCDAP